MEGEHPRVSSPSASQPTVTGNLRGLQCGDCGSGPRCSQCLRHPSMFPPGAGLVRGLAQPPNPDNVQLRDRKNRKRIYCPSMFLLSFSSLVFFFFFFATGCIQLSVVWFIQFIHRHPCPVCRSFVSGWRAPQGWSVRAEEQRYNHSKRQESGRLVQSAHPEWSPRAVLQGLGVATLGMIGVLGWQEPLHNGQLTEDRPLVEREGTG